jgi:type VI protein secretion system component VasK
LWLEVTGVIFLILALSFAGATVKEYEKYHAGGAGSSRLVIAICFTVTFAWFGLSSFWRARRKSQRP